MKTQSPHSQASAAKYTPGPWEVPSASPYRVVAVYRNSTGALLGCVYICDTANNARTRTPETEANARLIAAAPELLEALEAIYQCGSIKEAERIAEAAINKATRAIPVQP